MSITNRFINLVQITIICALLSIIEESGIRTGEKMSRMWILLVVKFIGGYKVIPLLVPFSLHNGFVQMKMDASNALI